jgi:hypothetical protein
MSVTQDIWPSVDEATRVAHEVLRNNLHGHFHGLPRTAAWGYPEPYTRDLLLSSLAALVTQDDELLTSLQQVLETLAENQTSLGHIPSLVHSREHLGASDTTPLFLMVLAMFRRVTGRKTFLERAARKALVWMDYRSSDSRVMVDQQPTTDWRDEQWVTGHGLYVNALVYVYLRLFGEQEKAAQLHDLMHRFAVTNAESHGHVHRGLLLPHKPYFALWAFKEFSNERFDLMGNSLAILSGLASPSRSENMVGWIEKECEHLRQHRDLAVDLPPCLFPYMRRGDPDYFPRVQRFNPPGCYCNGGIWPHVCGFYIAALVAAGKMRLAEKKLAALTDLVRRSRDPDLEYGFNEWHQAQDGLPKGQDWQSWSAALYIYAAECVRRETTPLFDEVRGS